MPNPVFLDSSGLIAAIRRNDSLHRKARRVLESFADEGVHLITSEWVLCEFLAGAARRPMRAVAIDVVDQLRSSNVAEIVSSGPRAFAAALDLYRRRTDKEWSLVDCSSILICQDRGIRQVFTHDHHFRQAGFETLLV
ncbi:MAG: type II toxin-antitoxin system VapC family toxin [Phycisphaerales bacterium]